MIKFAKIMGGSAFGGVAVMFVCLAWVKIAPHPASMFFHPGWRISELAMMWAAGSVLLMAGAVGLYIAKDIR